MRNWYTTICLYAWCVGTVMAQSDSLRVHVSDKRTQENLLGATVHYRHHTKIAQFTDLMGNAYLPHVPELDTVEVSYVGFRPYQFICQPTDTLKEVQLIPESNLLAVVSVSTKRPIAEEFVLKKLGFFDIVFAPSAFADPLLAVRSLPSATNTDESATVSFRGSSPLATGIILNDVPVYDVSKFSQLNGVGTLSIFPLQLVSEVLSFAANPPIEFGHASSGLIQVNTSDKQTPRFLNATLGLANSNLVVGQPIGKNWMLKGFIGFQSGPLLKTINPNSFQDIKTFNLVDGGWHIAYQTDRNALKIYGYFLNEHYSVNDQQAGYTTLFDSRKKRLLLNGQYTHRFDKGDWNLSGGWSHSDALASGGNFQEFKQPLDVFGSASVRYFFNESVSLRAGFSTDQRRLTTQGQYPIYSLLLRPTDPVYADTATIRLHLLEGYAFLKYKPSEHWVFGGGTRYGLADGGKSMGAQLSARYSKNEQQFINLGIGQYYTYSTVLTDRYHYLKFASRQLSVDYSRKGERLSWTASIFGQQQIQPEVISIGGLESSIKWIVSKYTSVDGSFSILKSPVKLLSDSSLSVGSLASNRNGIYGKATIQQQISRWGLAVSGIYHNQRFATSVSTAAYSSPLDAYLPVQANSYQPLSDYFRCDATLNRLFLMHQQQVIFFLTIANLFNTANTRGLIYNADYSENNKLYFQKRFIYIGVSVNLR